MGVAAAPGVAADVDDHLDPGVTDEGAEDLRLEGAVAHRPHDR